MDIIMDIVIGKTYQHYKGELYRVIDIVKDCDTCEDVIIYEALYHNPISSKWCRKAVDFSALVNGGIPRFILVNKVGLKDCPLCHSAMREHHDADSCKQSGHACWHCSNFVCRENPVY